VGWAGPTNWAGLSPKRVGPILAQQFILLLLLWAGSPKGWASIGLAQEGKNEEWNYFRSACRRK